MFAVIYRFKLKPQQESAYKICWDKVSSYFMEKCGAIGSSLHKGADGLWVGYSRWPDRATRDAAWPGDNAPNENLPHEIREMIKQMQNFEKENSDLEKFEDICLEVVLDKLG